LGEYSSAGQRPQHPAYRVWVGADQFRDGFGRQGPVTQHVGNAELRRCVDGPRENAPVIMSRTAIGAGTSF
jgi:hypothetical protein